MAKSLVSCFFDSRCTPSVIHVNFTVIVFTENKNSHKTALVAALHADTIPTGKFINI